MVPGSFKLTADDPKFPILFDAGKFKSIWFALDNTYANDTLGVKAAPPQALRVAVLDYNGLVMQVEDFLVGRGPKDNGTKPMWVNFKDATKANMVMISQGSKGSCDQRIAFCLI